MLYSAPPAREATELVLSGRKTWKMSKSKADRVWPPIAEATLIEGLSLYQPESGKDISKFKRFPKRNVWLSDYIKARTGISRTAKQVGSRLQQLKDSSKDKLVLRLVDRKPCDGANNDSPSPYASTSNSPASTAVSDTSSSSYCSLSIPSDIDAEVSEVLYLETTPHTNVCIKLADSFSHCGNLGDSDTQLETSPTSIDLRLDSTLYSIDAQLTSWKDPVVLLHMGQPFDYTNHHCLFKVVVGGRVLHRERAQFALRFVSLETRDASSEETFVYEAKFLSSYWTRIFSFNNLSSCQVYQQIIERGSASGILSDNDEADDQIVHVVRYTFAHARSSDDVLYFEAEENQPIQPPSLLGTTARGADALGLDGPTFHPRPEPPMDGRAHFPVQALQEFYCTALPPSSTSQDLAQPQYYAFQLPSSQRTYGQSCVMPPPTASDSTPYAPETSHGTYAFDFSLLRPSPVNPSPLANPVEHYHEQPPTFRRNPGWEQQPQPDQRAQYYWQNFPGQTYADDTPEHYVPAHPEIKTSLQTPSVQSHTGSVSVPPSTTMFPNTLIQSNALSVYNSSVPAHRHFSNGIVSHDPITSNATFVNAHAAYVQYPANVNNGYQM